MKLLSCAIRQTVRKLIFGAVIPDCAYQVTGDAMAKSTAAGTTRQMRQKAVILFLGVHSMNFDAEITAACPGNLYATER